MRQSLILALALPMSAAFGLSGISAGAQAACPGGVASPAHILSSEGSVTLIRADGNRVAAADGTQLCPGDQILTGDSSAVDVRFDTKNSVTNVLSSSTVVIAEAPETDVTLSGGLMRFISSVRGAFRIRTPQTDAGIDGTEAMIAVDGPLLDTLVLVREGVVTVSAPGGTGGGIALAAGEASYASKNTSLVRATSENVPAKFRGYLLNPEGAADWAVYYPPMLLGSGDAALERAAALLDAGQPDQANALLQGYQGADQASALALRSLVATYRNRTDEGIQLAEQAVAADGGAGAAHIARSYALQGKGDVEGARQAARRSVVAAPQDAYAWARLGELELTVGNRTAARSAAQTSLGLAETSLGHTVLGFAELSSNDRVAAEAAFNEAIGIDSGAPLPRLGLGLTKISRGDLEAGRADLETAASMDPQRAQLRGWLGRAYLEEGLGEKALAQFGLAKEQDPDDPTPWLFSAQQQFAANRPVVALRELTEAERRADGRATLRGAEGLAEDQAVRATAQGRIFDVLGFEVQAAQAGARAVAANPSNPGAHRFLADVYRARPGFEIAQTSELLVAQLLTGPTRSPVQPRLAEADLALLNTTGTARVTFNEFAPVFDGDGIFAIASAALGNNAVVEDELSLSIKEGNFSLAFGQFHTQTNGFRENDDVKHDVIAVEAKAQVLPWLTLTAEGRVRETTEGDRFLRSFQDQTTERTETETTRGQVMLGGHAELSEDNDLLFFGAIASEDRREEVQFISGGTFFLDEANETTTSLTFEVQDTHRFDFGNLIVGGSFASIENDGELFNDPLFSFGDQIEHYSAYAYTNLVPMDGVELTLGVSFDQVNRSINEFDFFGAQVLAQRDESQVNPKAGIRLEPYDGVVLRGAYARTLKRELVQDRTLEPTTIAGFNQFFDDPSLTDSEMLAGGVDIRVLDNVWIGGEYIYRDLDIPDFDFDLATFANTLPVVRAGKERTVRGYVNATFGDNWAGSVGVEFSKNETELLDRPDIVDTLLVPVSVSYFDESGVFGTAEAIFFDQDSVGSAATPDATSPDGLLGVDTDEQGVILNAAIGYRLPNQRGVATLEFNNILDQDVTLQNPLNNSARPSTRPLAESFSVIGRFTIGF